MEQLVWIGAPYLAKVYEHWPPHLLLGDKRGLSDSPGDAHYWFFCAGDFGWRFPHDICCMAIKKFPSSFSCLLQAIVKKK